MMAAILSKPPPTLEGLPTEIMSYIVNNVDSDGRYTLRSFDVLNLRVASRRIRDTSFDTFAQRFFTHRKHILSAASLACLHGIAMHPILSNFVREVSIGPERLNSRFGKCTSEMAPDDQTWWKKHKQSHFIQEIQRQESFEASDKVVVWLSTALKACQRLQAVHINAYPNTETGGSWCDSWGTVTILNKLGRGRYPGKNWPNARSVLVDESYGVIFLHDHYRRILKSLLAIEDRKDWILHIGFDPLNLTYEALPFDLASHEWQAVKHRVSSMSQKKMLKSSRSSASNLAVWNMKLWQDCSNLKSVTLDHEYEVEQIFRTLQNTKIHVLSIYDCFIRDADVADLLVQHADSLHSLKLEDVHLNRFSHYDYSVPPQFNVKDPSWFEKLAIIRAMPKLSRLVLSNLTWSCRGQNQLPELQGDVALQKLGGGTAIVAVADDIKKRLDRTIQEGACIREKSFKLWFPAVL